MNDKSTQPSCHKIQTSCCPSEKKKTDYLLIISSIIIILTYTLHLVLPESSGSLVYFATFSASVYTFLNTMLIGIVIGIIFIALLGQIPREFIIALLGQERNAGGILRATLAGVLLDLCSHGILMVGAKLYERGASLGQVMAFLIASPWNSISLTLILWALVGFKWMMLFLLSSMLIGFCSGLLFEYLVKRNVLPDNPNRIDLPKNFELVSNTKKGLSEFNFTFSWLGKTFRQGLNDSKMVLRWIFFGIILAALIRTFISPEQFQTYFGPTLFGLGMTIIVATVLEVCSEGTLPIASDILIRAGAPGNSFTFLMTGVVTDYTEIMVLKEATNSWKIPLFLPFVVLPQVLIFALIFNIYI